MNNKNISKDSISFVPVCIYLNASIEKKNILMNNKDKSGVYIWINKVNGKMYVGSSVSLSKRFWFYYSLNSSNKNLNKRRSGIYNAILKYDFSNFRLDILEYCEVNVLIEREQYYIDLLKPEYNILKTAGSSLGFKHSEATKALIAVKNTGVNNPLFGKKHTKETIKKIREN